MAEDAFLRALTALEEVIAENDRRATLIKKRMARIRKARAQGLPYSDMVSNEDGPLIVQLLTESSMELDTCGANVRRAEAQALYGEGMTMDQIAERFGVTRQRVSALLRKVR
jgi:DNA-directed RNA polymerase sigma subunit (sigma70/sigma32)